MAQTHLTKTWPPFSDDPTPIYEYRQTTIDILKANHILSRDKNIDVPIHYVHEQYVLHTIDPIKFKNTIQPADIGT